MVSASVVTLLYWAAFLMVLVYFGVLVGRELDRRHRVRRMRERRLRRRLRDARDPQRWTS